MTELTGSIKDVVAYSFLDSFILVLLFLPLFIVLKLAKKSCSILLQGEMDWIRVVLEPVRPALSGRVRT